MINLKKGNTTVVYFTGTEKAVLTAPYFLLIFTNNVTSEVVKIMATNTSTTARYDKFSLVVNTYFTSSTNGFYNYEIYEKESNLDMEISGNIVEQGYMHLTPATAFAPTDYTDQVNTFKTYNG